MDSLLASIAGFSLLLTVGMAGMLFKVLGEERRRSDARVAALTAASARAGAHLDAPSGAEEGTHTVPLRAALFARVESPSPWRTRIAVAAGVASIAALGTYTLSQRAAAPDAAEPGRGDAAATPARLELVALQHSHERGALTITGTVANPADGVAVDHVFATAVLYRPDGSVLTSVRKALDETTLLPGGESPFVITVPDGGQVARYRVGFRTPAGTVIGHVDRRADITAARPMARSADDPWQR